ncbi:hypothetical protein Vadar_004623 [Vaccinium darrowii]|uniref:Uncharacterized protein n=1 Tax=Vaccinium darrowii TaxID=229202 RepID=A0ACB7XN96_9ERIC|nr:hypothetical protein Vadar_004623 [Vaccinium darrowii]
MWFHLRRQGAPRGRRPNEHKVPVGGPKEVIRSPDEDTKPYINTMSVVAALIATLTFAAAFTMPGGCDSSPDNLGGATLVKKAALRAFILSDTLAMCCSITVVSLLWRAIHVEQDLKFVLTNASVILLHIALLATLVAFMSGIFAVIAPKALWIAILVCIVCPMVFCLLTPERVQRSSVSTWFMPNIITRDILRFIRLKQGMNKRKRDQPYVKSLIQRRSPDTNYCRKDSRIALVAAVIATLTFAAAFTMPASGYDNSSVATLEKKATLWVFILSDTLAICCSITVVFLLLWTMVAQHDAVLSLINASSILLSIALRGWWLLRAKSSELSSWYLVYANPSWRHSSRNTETTTEDQKNEGAA